MSKYGIEKLIGELWDCDNDHTWVSYPGRYPNSWRLEQVHESTTGTYMKLDDKQAWLVSGPDPSICPACGCRMWQVEPEYKDRIVA